MYCDILSESHNLCHISLGDVRLAMLQFQIKLQECIRMGIPIFTIFIWGGISSDIQSEIREPSP